MGEGFIRSFRRRWRMTPTNRRRLWGMPLRIVVLLPFFLVARLGEMAERMGSAIEPYLPKGFEG